MTNRPKIKFKIFKIVKILVFHINIKVFEISYNFTFMVNEIFSLFFDIIKCVEKYLTFGNVAFSIKNVDVFSQKIEIHLRSM